MLGITWKVYRRKATSISSLPLPSHTHEPPNSLQGSIIVTRVEGIAKGIVDGVVHGLVEGVEGAKDGVFGYEVEQVLHASVQLEALPELSGKLQIQDGVPWCVFSAIVVGHDGQPLRAEPVARQVEGELAAGVGVVGSEGAGPSWRTYLLGLLAVPVFLVNVHVGNACVEAERQAVGVVELERDAMGDGVAI